MVWTLLAMFTPGGPYSVDRLSIFPHDVLRVVIMYVV